MSEIRSWPTWAKWAAGIFIVLVVIGIATGNSEDSDDSKSDEPESVAVRETADVEKEKDLEEVEFEVTRPQDSATVHRRGIEVRVKTVPDATVTINGGPTRDLGNGRFAKRLGVHLGDNDIPIEVSAPGFEDARDTLTITRKRSAAELAALRQARAERRAREEAEFRAGAQTIDYDQLAKNPDRYRGTRVVYRGQMFQIGEDYGSTWMLLAVTDEGYGFWDDNIWVEYDGTINGAEDDIITVYGTVRGQKSYETQIGGETYVPKVKARYIDE